jgi:hypothetical protein
MRRFSHRYALLFRTVVAGKQTAMLRRGAESAPPTLLLLAADASRPSAVFDDSRNIRL